MPQALETAPDVQLISNRRSDCHSFLSELQPPLRISRPNARPSYRRIAQKARRNGTAPPLIALLIVWFMTLLIQRAEHRDTRALQAKIDELLHANTQADSAVTKIDDNEPEDIERLRTKARLKD